MQRYVSKSKAVLISCETLDVLPSAKTCQDQLSVQTYRVMCCCFLAQIFVLCMFRLTEHLEMTQKGWTAGSLRIWLHPVVFYAYTSIYIE